MDYTFHDNSKGISSAKSENSLLYHPHGDGKCHSAHNIPEASQQPKSLEVLRFPSDMKRCYLPPAQGRTLAPTSSGVWANTFSSAATSKI